MNIMSTFIEEVSELPNVLRNEKNAINIKDNSPAIQSAILALYVAYEHDSFRARLESVREIPANANMFEIFNEEVHDLAQFKLDHSDLSN